MSLKGRKAIVTGAARGLGASIANGFVDAGMQVVLMDIRHDAVCEVAHRLGPSASAVACDVASEADVEAAFATAAATLGGLDVLAAVAGLDRPGHAAEDLPLAVWDHVLSVNATGTYLTNRAAFRLMRPRGGRIINFASVAGIRGYAERAAYAAAKGAVLAWTRSVAQAWGRHDVTVNAIAPQMHTEAADRFLARLDAARLADFEDRLAKTVPIGGRLGDPATELVPLLLFLAGEGSAFITGQTFAVDGGMTMLGS